MAGVVVILLIITICATAVGMWTSFIGIGFGRGFMFGSSGTAIALGGAWLAVKREKKQ